MMSDLMVTCHGTTLHPAAPAVAVVLRRRIRP
jgi:hypothetical protein